MGIIFNYLMGCSMEVKEDNQELDIPYSCISRIQAEYDDISYTNNKEM